MKPLVDIGANLTHDSFSQDLHEVLERALDHQVIQMVVTGACRDSNPRAVQLAKKFPAMLYATAGIHPHHAEETSPTLLSEIRELASEDCVKAIGETGLDFFRDFSPRTVQEKSFESHIEMAMALQMPLFLHERDAWPRFAQILKSYRDQLGNVVVHCFTGAKEALYDYLDMDCHIGITGWLCDERRGAHLIPLMSSIPADRLMIESDAPYLLPRTIRPKPKSRRNEPFYLPFVCEAVAMATGRTTDQIAQETTGNARRFFNLETPDDR